MKAVDEEAGKEVPKWALKQRMSSEYFMSSDQVHQMHNQGQGQVCEWNDAIINETQ